MSSLDARRCAQCGVLKTSENTNKLRTRRSGLAVYCRVCANGALGRYRRQNPAAVLWSAAKNRARIMGLAFTIEVADVVIPSKCPVLSIPIEWTAGARTDRTPSLDRVVPANGYVPGNIAVISWRANRLKSDASLEELQALAAFYTSR